MDDGSVLFALVIFLLIVRTDLKTCKAFVAQWLTHFTCNEKIGCSIQPEGFLFRSHNNLPTVERFTSITFGLFGPPY